MSGGFKAAAWAVAIALVAACTLTLLLLLVPAFLPDPLAQAIADPTAAAAGLLCMVVPVLELANLVLGVVAAATPRPDALPTARAIMLLFKVGLIPFFLMGGCLMALCLILGLHPVLPFIGWGMAAALAAMGWTALASGSIWAIGCAVSLLRSGAIGGGELAVHVVLQLLFVGDVVDAVWLFVRSAPATRALRAPNTVQEVRP